MPNKPVPYPGDEYIKQLIAGQGYFKKDANGNTIIGQNVEIDTLSVGNFITADNAVVVKSHNNILNAKNIHIEFANGCRADGADHKIIGKGNTTANYSSTDGDANWIEGYSSNTSGFGNVNCCEFGRISGNNNRIGIKGQPNQFRNSTIDGNNCEIDGSHCHAIGSFIKIIGDNITVIGNPPPETVFISPGVYIIQD